MTVHTNDMDLDLILDTVASSDGDFSLVAERLDKKHAQPFGTTKEYDIKDRISKLDIQTSDRLSAKLRVLLTIKLYNVIMQVTQQLELNLGDLKPAELARTHASLINSFSSLTSSSTKITFDFEREIQDIAREFPDVDVESIRGELKQMEQRVKLVK